LISQDRRRWTAAAAGCSVLVVSLGELLVRSLAERPGDVLPVLATGLVLAATAAAATAAASRFIRPDIAIAGVLTPVFWIVALDALADLAPIPASAWLFGCLALIVAAGGALAAAAFARARAGFWGLGGGASATLIGALAVHAAGLPSPRPPADGEHPDIVFLVMDATRRDHRSLYGYGRETSPALDRLAERAVIYDDAWSVAPWTSPSHASMFTGLLPAEHGTAGRDAPPLSEQPETLMAVLQRAGYRTAGFPANPNLVAHGWSRGFDVYHPPWYTGGHSFIRYLNRFLLGSTMHWRIDSSTAHVFGRARRWWEANGDGPRFLFLNLVDPHDPYRPPEGDREHFLPGVDRDVADSVEQSTSYYYATGAISPDDAAIIPGLYDAEIRAMDRQLGLFFAWLGERGELDDTLAIITSDHGERLGERGTLGHLMEMDQHLLRVPLVVHYPARLTPRRVERRVRLTGLPGFILHTAGVPAPEIMAARALQRPTDSLAVAQHRDFGWYIGRIQRWNPSFDAAPYGGDWHFVADARYAWIGSSAHAAGSGRLIDYRADGDLERDLSRELPHVVERLRRAAEALPQFAAASPVADEPRLEATAQEHLRALGYVE
jgi:arylsulfatase A-like enzyme